MSASMHCHDFDERLHQYLDDRTDPTCDQELREHAWHCSTCRGNLVNQGVILESLRHLQSDLEVARPATKLTVRQRAARWVQVAVVVAVIGSVGLFAARGLLSATPERSMAMRMDDNIKSLDSVAHSQAVATTLRTTADHLASSLVDKPLQTIHDVRFLEGRLGQIEVWTPVPLSGLIHDAEQHSEWFGLTDTFSRPFRPVATSMTTAIGVIRQTLPGSRGDLPAPPQANRLNGCRDRASLA